jgi:Bacteriophage Gp15 protein.
MDLLKSDLHPIFTYKKWDFTLNLSLERVLNAISALDEEADIKQLDRFYLVLDNLLDVNSNDFDTFEYLEEMTCFEQ